MESCKQRELQKRKQHRGLRRSQTHKIGIVNEGHILGLEEAVLAPTTPSVYGFTVTCLQDSELFRIEKTSFVNKLTS